MKEIRFLVDGQWYCFLHISIDRLLEQAPTSTAVAPERECVTCAQLIEENIRSTAILLHLVEFLFPELHPKEVILHGKGWNGKKRAVSVGLFPHGNVELCTLEDLVWVLHRKCRSQEVIQFAEAMWEQFGAAYDAVQERQTPSPS